MTDSRNLPDLSATRAAEEIRAGSFRAETYARALLERADRAEPTNAFSGLSPERVLEAARRADRERERGELAGRLHGVPIAVKDNLDVAGLPTTASTPGLSNHIPRRTAPALRALFAEGGYLLSKTHMDELALGIAGENAHTGAIRNPYDTAASPGGSSAGAAAAVAARCAPLGVGTDTGGSIRIPAAHCGLVGFRPSTGRYPAAGLVPMSRSRDAVGLLARTVDDIALADAALAGAPTLRPEIGVRGLRLGVPRRGFWSDSDPEIAALAEAELSRLEGLGAEIVDVDFSDFSGRWEELSSLLTAREMPRDFDAYLREAGSNLGLAEIAPQIATPPVRQNVESLLRAAGHPGLAPLYSRAAREQIPRWRADYQRRFRGAGITALAFPTCPLAPGPAGREEWVDPYGEARSVWEGQTHVVMATMVGAPAISVPIGMTPANLPVGLELDGLPGRDPELLAAACAWADTTGPFRPPRFPLASPS